MLIDTKEKLENSTTRCRKVPLKFLRTDTENGGEDEFEDKVVTTTDIRQKRLADSVSTM